MTGLSGNCGLLCLAEARMNRRSNHLLTMEVDYGLIVGSPEISRAKGQENREAAIDPKQDQPNREMNQGPSERRARVATVRGDRNDGRWVGDDGLAHEIGSVLPDHDMTLDLCASPYHGDRGLGQRSTGLSTPDSYGTQPCKLRQRHLAQARKVKMTGEQNRSEQLRSWDRESAVSGTGPFVSAFLSGGSSFGLGGTGTDVFPRPAGETVNGGEQGDARGQYAPVHFLSMQISLQIRGGATVCFD